jgi:hypothetical protein
LVYSSESGVLFSKDKTILIRVPAGKMGSYTIPSSVTSIGNFAFESCGSLKSVIIPNSVTSIGDWMFYECSGLTSVTIPNSVTDIGESAFSGCSGLASVTIPNSVTDIGESAFSGCSGLASVVIPNSVTDIGESVFFGCRSLTSITIPDSVTSIGKGEFKYCSGLTYVIIPNSVTSIGWWAFSGCSGLTSVTIPDSVTSIGNGAFASCGKLTNIIVEPYNSIYSSESGVLFSKDKTTLIQVSDEKIGSYTIPNSVTFIKEYAFNDCSGLTSVTIPNSVTSIGNFAFCGCSSLTAITIPSSVTSIGYWAFKYCHSLTSVTIPNSVTSIGRSAFSGCTGLTSLFTHRQIPLYFPYTITGIFNGIDKNKCTLYVPKGAVFAYRVAYGWNYFTRMAEIPDKNQQRSSYETAYFNLPSVAGNPYRILGLLVGSTAREQNRQIRRLKQYIEAEQEPPADYSFPALGKLRRTVEGITEAASKLNLDSDRMSAALFWFYKGNEITDEPALDALKEGDTNSAFDIWNKLTSSGEITQRNASAFQNLSTLLLANASSYNLEQGTVLKLKFLESDFAKDFKALATDVTYKTTKKELQLLFLNQLCAKIENSGDTDVNQLVGILQKQTFSAKEDFFNGFAQKLIDEIQRKCNETKSKRENNRKNAAKYGKELYKDTLTRLQQVKSVLGASHLKFSSASDKLSIELLQCGIDYFNQYKESNTDPGADAMDLYKKAQALAVGHIAKERCKTNIENLQKWINDKPERDKKVRIRPHLDSLLNKTQLFETKPATIANAKALLNQVKPDLYNIKSVLGTTDSLYLKLSTQIAVQAQNYIIEEVNSVQKNLEMQVMLDRYGTLNRLKTVLSNAWEATSLVGTLDLENDFRIKRYNPNRETLKGLCEQIGVSTSTGRSTSTSTSTSTNTGRSTSTTTSTSTGTGRINTPRPPSVPRTPYKSNSWADENSGCIVALVIGAIIVLMIILENIN